MTPPPPPPPLPSQQDPNMLEANGRYGRKPKSPSVIVFLNVVNTVTQLLLGAVAISAFTLANLFGNANSLSQHIYLCVIGYVILMSQAILSFNSHAGWTYSLKFIDKRIIHATMQISGSILAIIGSIIRIVDTNVHFDTPHGITGIFAMILTCISLFGGFLNLLPNQKNTLIIKTLHSCVGSLTISVAFISLCLAFNNGLFKFLFGDLNANIAVSLTVFALAGILISAFTRLVNKFVYGDDV